MTHGSLFSGIGGFDLAASWAGWQNIFQCEKDPYCNAVLAKNFPNVKRYGDIKATNFEIYRGRVGVLSGGFPCQPFSQVGKRGGLDDDRYLWPEFERAIDEILPSWVVGENVIGIKNMALDLVCSSLESRGFAVWPVVIPASGVGNWSRRDRVWIVAHNPDNAPDLDRERLQGLSRPVNDPQGRPQDDGYGSSGYWRHHWPTIVPEFCGDNARIPARMERIKSLGNAIVPQVALEIFKAINETR